jgi:glycyl-tRNA synthetase (class II)
LTQRTAQTEVQDPADTALMEKITALHKLRRFICQSSEIYGGTGGFWDYDPMGRRVAKRLHRLRSCGTMRVGVCS